MINLKRHTTMAISNCSFSPTSENPHGFSARCVLAKFRAKPWEYFFIKLIENSVSDIISLKSNIK